MPAGPLPPDHFPHRVPPPSGFSLRVDVREATTRVRFAGELDTCTAPLVAAALMGLRDHHPGPAPADGTVLLDLSAVTFMDSSGLSAITDTLAGLTQHVGAVHLTHPQPSVRRLLTFAVRAGWLPSAEEGAIMDTTTRNSARTEHLLALMKSGDDGFNSKDFAAMNAVHHPDMIVHMPGNGQPIVGREAHAEAMKQMFGMFPDVHVSNDPYPIQFGSGDWITVVTRCTGTFSGEMVGPDGTVIVPTGKAFDLDFATTAKWDGDLLLEEFVSWDSALQAQQIGLA